MDIKKYIRFNIYTAIILGSIPATLIAHYGSVPSLFVFLNSLNPSNIVFIYMLSLYLFYFLISGLLIFLKKYNILQPVWLLNVQIFFKHAGHTMHGVILIMAGALIVSVIPIIFVEPSIISFAMAFIACTFSLTLIVGGCYISKTKAHIESAI